MFSVWILSSGMVFHSRKINNRIDSLHKRALRVVYRYYNAKFPELPSKDKSVTITKEILRQKMN